LAESLGVVGLMNAQFAIQGQDVFILEVNPRASRTVPFVSKATGYQLAKVAARCMVGRSLAEQGIVEERVPAYFSVKEAVFPFIKFPGVDPVLGPEMKSTGEVMGIGETFGEAYGKAQRAANVRLPTSGVTLISIRDADKAKIVPIARDLVAKGFSIVATRGTAQVLVEAGVPCDTVNKVYEGRPHIVDMIKNGQLHLIINTTEGAKAIADSFTIRRQALQRQITYTTTVSGARAICYALENANSSSVSRLQDLHQHFQSGTPYRS
jgi:carbamoyl-phosphate synthase large subunit